MQPYNEYEIGQSIVLEGKTTDDEGFPTMPAGPKILLQDPTGTESSLDVESELGSFAHELHLTGPAGLYVYRLLTSNDAAEHFFYVRESGFSAPLG